MGATRSKANEVPCTVRVSLGTQTKLRSEIKRHTASCGWIHSDLNHSSVFVCVHFEWAYVQNRDELRSFDSSMEIQNAVDSSQTERVENRVVRRIDFVRGSRDGGLRR
jgi:hypothetical protein